MNIIPAEWLRRYLEKAKPQFLLLDNMIITEWGFSSYLVLQNKIRVVDCYGSFDLWLEFYLRLCKSLKFDRFDFWTRRNPDAFIRLFRRKSLKAEVVEVKSDKVRLEVEVL